MTDVLIAGLALALLSPLMALIAAAIAIEIGTPIFYSQTRVRRAGRKFTIWKFRKFHVRNDAPGPLLTVGNDARLSRIGRLLEKTKLDELPQFWNVLRGDMKIVGPRPQNSIITACLTPEFRGLLDHEPGIFGPSQVAFRSENALYPAHLDPHAFYRETIFPIKARLDLSYYPHRTWLRDMAWVVRGILAVCGLYPVVRHLTAGGTVSAGKAPAVAAGQVPGPRSLGAGAGLGAMQNADR